MFRDMVPILVLFGLLIWYIDDRAYRGGGGSRGAPSVVREIKSKNVREFEGAFD